MIVNIGPSFRHWEETIISLKFAERAKKVENKPQINKKVDYKVLVMQLQEEVDANADVQTELQIRLRNAEEELEKEWDRKIAAEERIRKLESELREGVTKAALDDYTKEINQKEDELSDMSNTV